MANLTLPSNPTNGQKVTVGDKVFVYSNTYSRWTATKLNVFGNLTGDFTIAPPELSLSNNTVAFDTTGETVYITYTVDQDVKATIANNGIANSSYANVTLHQTNNTIQITAGTESFSGANVVLTVTNTRTSNTASIDLSAAYRFTFADLSSVSIDFDARSQYGLYKSGSIWGSSGGFSYARFGRGLDLSEYSGFENEVLWFLTDGDGNNSGFMIEIVSTDINADYMPSDGGEIPNERRHDFSMASANFPNASNRVIGKGVYGVKIRDTGNGKPTMFCSTSDGQIIAMEINKGASGNFTFTKVGTINLFSSVTSGQMLFGFDIFEESGTTYIAGQTFEGQASGGYWKMSATIWSLSYSNFTATEVGKSTPSTGSSNSFHSSGTIEIFYDPVTERGIGACTKLGKYVVLDFRSKTEPFHNVNSFSGANYWYTACSPLNATDSGGRSLFAFGDVTNDDGAKRILVLNSIGSLQMNIYYDGSADMKTLFLGERDGYLYIPKGGDGEYPVFVYDFETAGIGNVDLEDYSTEDNITRILTDAGNGYSSSRFIGACFTTNNQKLMTARHFNASNYQKIGYQVLS